jgi:hypothetical protein
MADWKLVSKLALALPETTESTSHEHVCWMVRDKMFAWERPLRRSDLEALGKSAPKGAILGLRTESLLAKEAMLKAMPSVCFTTPHFDGYPAVLVQLGKVSAKKLEAMLTEAWLSRAPKKTAREFLADR